MGEFGAQTGKRSEHELGRGWFPGEATFAPSEQASGEDHGSLISIVTHGSEDRAQLLVQDASDPNLKPVATVILPRRVRAGFHGACIGGGRWPHYARWIRFHALFTRTPSRYSPVQAS
jgi:carotenoid cleavage dioxygenase-like enzyme